MAAEKSKKTLMPLPDAKLVPPQQIFVWEAAFADYIEKNPTLEARRAEIAAAYEKGLEIGSLAFSVYLLTEYGATPTGTRLMRSEHRTAYVRRQNEMMNGKKNAEKVHRGSISTK